MSSAAVNVPLSHAAMRRLMKEAHDVRENPLPGISLAPSEDNLAVWHANVAVTGGVYDGLVMHILLECPHNYPNNAPNAYFVNPVSYQNGATQIVPGKGMSVCLNLFGNYANIHREWGKNGEASGWSVSYTLQTALLALQGLLPNDMLSTASSCVSQALASSKSLKCPCGHSGCSAEHFKPCLPDAAAVVPAHLPVPRAQEICRVIEGGLTLQEVQEVAGVQWMCLSAADGQKFYARCSPPDGFAVDPSLDPVLVPAAPEIHIVCYALHKTPKSDPGEIFGFGVAIERQSISTPAEVLCKEAFDSGIRTSSQNAVFQNFLPLFINEAHWIAARPLLLQMASAMWPSLSRVPEPIPAVAAARVVCRLMNNVVVDVMKADRSSAASDNFITGYFSLLRLLARLAADNPEVQHAADSDWSSFMASSTNRHKDKCPNIGDILPLLCISSRYSWQDVAAAYQEESHKRNVRWYLHDHPHLATAHPNDDRILVTFAATAVSRRMACFQARFTSLGKAQLPFSFADGSVPAPLLAAIKQTYQEADSVKSWKEHYEFLGLIAPADMRAELEHAMSQSLLLGYHGGDSHKPNNSGAPQRGSGRGANKHRGGMAPR
jgi:ubiquitin-protein ligase